MLSITPTSRSSRVTSRPASSSQNGLNVAGNAMAFGRIWPVNRNSWSQDCYKQMILQNMVQDQHDLALHNNEEEAGFSRGNHPNQLPKRGEGCSDGLENKDHIREEPRRRSQVESNLKCNRNAGGSLSDLDDVKFTATHDAMVDDILQIPITPTSEEFAGPSGKPLGVEVASNACKRKEYSTGSMKQEYAPQALRILKKERSSLPGHPDTKKESQIYQGYPHNGDIHERSFFDDNGGGENLREGKSSPVIRLKTSSPAKVTVQNSLVIERPQSMCASIHEAREQVQLPGSPWPKPLPPTPPSKGNEGFRSSLPTIPSNESLRLFSSQVGGGQNGQPSTSSQEPVRKHSLPTHALMRPIQAGEQIKSAIQPCRVLAGPTIEPKQSLSASLPRPPISRDNTDNVKGNASQLLYDDHPAFRSSFNSSSTARLPTSVRPSEPKIERLVTEDTSPTSLLSRSSTLVQTSGPGGLHAPPIETAALMNARVAKESADRNKVEAEQEARIVAQEDKWTRNMAYYFWHNNGRHLHSAVTYNAPAVLNTCIQSTNANNFAANSQIGPILSLPPGSPANTRVISVLPTDTAPTSLAPVHGAPTPYGKSSIIKIAQILSLDALKDGKMIKKRLGNFVAVDNAEKQIDQDTIEEIVAKRTAELRVSMGMKAEEAEPGRFRQAKDVSVVRKGAGDGANGLL